METLVITAKATDCRRVGHRKAHNAAAATPPATASQVIRMGAVPVGPSDEASNASRHATIEAPRKDIRARVAPRIPRSAR
jgi:hypothetical protein